MISIPEAIRDSVRHFESDLGYVPGEYTADDVFNDVLENYELSESDEQYLLNLINPTGKDFEQMKADEKEYENLFISLGFGNILEENFID